MLVERIEKKDKNLFCYVGVPVSFLGQYRPFDSALLHCVKNKMYHPVVVEIVNTRNEGAVISQDLATYLKLKVNDQIVLEKIFNITPATSIDVIVKKIEDQTKKQVEGEPQIDFQRLLKRIKQNLKYTYLVDGFFLYDEDYKLTFRINDINKKYCHVLPFTSFNIRTKTATEEQTLLGLDQAYSTLKEFVQWPATYGQYYQELKVSPPKGILITGPPGCGKTHLMRQLAKVSEIKIYKLRGPQILSRYLGGSEQNLRAIFDEAKRNQPSLIIIDQIDSFGRKRSQGSEAQARLVSQLLSCMDGIDQRGNVLVIATTNNPSVIDPALRRPGRFDKEILIKPPSPIARKTLLQIFFKGVPLDKQIDLADLAEKTNGFVHADLKYFVTQCKLNVIRRFIEARDKGFEQTNGVESPQVPLKITLKDCEVALKKIKPSALRQFQSYDTNVHLDDVVGYSNVKERLIQQITYPIKYRDLYKSLNVKKLKGLIIAGPPGTGKTLIAKALATEMNHNFLYVSPSDMLSKYVGETENNIKNLFQKAKESEPCIVFLDQIDGLFGKIREEGAQTHDVSRGTQFLSLMDGIIPTEEDIFFIGTTNRPDLLDSALLRSGRFELLLRMDYPNKTELEQLYRFYFKGMLDQSCPLDHLVRQSLKNKVTGSDIVAVKRLCVSLRIPSLISTSGGVSHLEQVKVSEQEILNALRSFLKFRHKNEQKLRDDY